MDAASLLRSCREQSGLSQRQLARRAGTSAGSISLYESGGRMPRTDTLIRLIAATGASVQFGATPRNPVDPESAERAFRAAVSLAAALPYLPAATIETPIFADLAS